jgi:hypothetical protein
MTLAVSQQDSEIITGGRMNTGEFTPLVVSVEDAMRVSCLGRTYLYQLLNDGSIASIKRGKRRLVLYQSLKQFLSAQAPVQGEWR